MGSDTGCNYSFGFYSFNAVLIPIVMNTRRSYYYMIKFNEVNIIRSFLFSKSGCVLPDAGSVLSLSRFLSFLIFVFL